MYSTEAFAVLLHWGTKRCLIRMQLQDYYYYYKENANGEQHWQLWRALPGLSMRRQKSATSTEIFFLNLRRVRVSKSCRLQWNFQMEWKQFVPSGILTILHFDKPRQINKIRSVHGGGGKGGCGATEGNRSAQWAALAAAHTSIALFSLVPLSQICTLLLHDKATVVLQLQLLLAFIHGAHKS